jgi:hypothetical protein
MLVEFDGSQKVTAQFLADPVPASAQNCELSREIEEFPAPLPYRLGA